MRGKGNLLAAPHTFFLGTKKVALFVEPPSHFLVRRNACRCGHVTESHEVPVHFSTTII